MKRYSGTTASSSTVYGFFFFLIFLATKAVANCFERHASHAQGPTRARGVAPEKESQRRQTTVERIPCKRKDFAPSDKGEGHTCKGGLIHRPLPQLSAVPPPHDSQATSQEAQRMATQIVQHTNAFDATQCGINQSQMKAPNNTDGDSAMAAMTTMAMNSMWQRSPLAAMQHGGGGAAPGTMAAAPGSSAGLPLQSSSLALLQYHAAMQQLIAAQQVQQAAAACVVHANHTTNLPQLLWQLNNGVVHGGGVQVNNGAQGAAASNASHLLQAYPAHGHLHGNASVVQAQGTLAGGFAYAADGPAIAFRANPAPVCAPSDVASKRVASIAASAAASTGATGQLELVFPRRGRKTGDLDGKVHEPVVITMEVMQKLFHLPLAQASTQLGLSPTAIKGVCRRMGIKKWPFRMVTAKSHRRVRKPREDIIADALLRTTNHCVNVDTEDARSGLLLLSGQADEAGSIRSSSSKSLPESPQSTSE